MIAFKAKRENLAKDWQALKKQAHKSIIRNNIELALHQIEGLGYFGYTFNHLDSFFDKDVDDYIETLIWKTVGFNTVIPNKNKIVFYDFHVLENRGFTQQYLDVLIKGDFEILFICFSSSHSKTNNIIETLNSYKRGSIYVIEDVDTKLIQLKKLVDHISSFSPSKIFIHNAPWDILSCLMAGYFKKSPVKTYLINITDHTYWPGKSIFDYIIDFRKFGHVINKYHSNISNEHLLLIPTPPFLDKSIAFQGFPNIPKNQIIGFTGGNVYKIIDEQQTFLNLLKDSLKDNEKLTILFANVGGEDFLNTFIAKHKLEQRLILIGNRLDINEVFKRVDIYLNTYPYGGGLMIQYAIANRKPILAFHNDNLIHTRIDIIIDKLLDEKHIISDRTKYHQTLKELINNNDFRTSFSNEQNLNYNLQPRFEQQLTSLLFDDVDELNIENDIPVNHNGIMDFHILNENFFTKKYPSIKAIYFANKLIFRVYCKLRSFLKN